MYVWIFILFFPLSLWAVTPQQLDFEHSFTRAEGTIWGVEGTIWGTESSLAKKLDVPENQIPEIYKTPLQRPLPKRLPVQSPDLFFNDQVVVYNQIVLCADSKLNLDIEELQKELNEWSLFFSRPDPLPTKFQILLAPWKGATANCDVLVLQGKKDEFPFKFYSQNQTDPESKYWENRLYALFYQLSEKTLPVITIDPDILLKTRPDFTYYTQKQGNQVLVNAKILLLHELGHLLGFEHLGAKSSEIIDPNFTVMGKTNELRNKEEIQARFESSENLWMFWDHRQLSAYRKALWSDKPLQANKSCYVPGDQITLYLKGAFKVGDYPELLGRLHFRILEGESISPFDPENSEVRLSSFINRKNFHYRIDDDIFLSISSTREELPLTVLHGGVLPYGQRLRIFLKYEVNSINQSELNHSLIGFLSFLSKSPLKPNGPGFRKYIVTAPMRFDLAPTPDLCP